MSAPGRLDRERLLPVIAWTVAFAGLVAAGFAVVAAASASATFDPADVNVPVVSVALIAATTASFLIVGGRVAAGVVSNPIGWLLLAIGCCIAATLAGMAFVAHDLPGAQWGMWFTEWSSVCPFFVMVYVLLLFPEGRLPDKRWKPALMLTHALAAATLLQVVVPYTERNGAFTNPIGLHALGGTILSGNKLGFLTLPLALVVAGVSAVSRWRRADQVAREQLKWFALAGGTVVAAFLVQELTWLAQTWLGATVAGAGLLLLVVSFSTIPVASGIAVLRYRLYDIDRVISRTLAYALLTGAVVSVYVGVIAILTAVVPTRSAFAVAAATLVAAAVVAPLRRRVQRLVDKRFNRAHYDAAALVDGFANQLRESTAAGLVSAQLTQAVARAVDPAHVSVWVRGDRLADAGPLA